MIGSCQHSSRFLSSVLLSLLFILIVAPVSAGQLDFGGGGIDEPNIEVSAVLSVTAGIPGETYRAAAVLDIPAPWHINSARPRDEFLIPAKVEFDTLAGLKPHGLAYPEGEQSLLLGDTMDLYSGQTIISFSVTVAEGATGELKLPVRVTYQPCNDVECRAPATVETVLTVPVGEEVRPANGRIFGKLPPTAATGGETPGEGSGGEAGMELGAVQSSAPVEEESDLARLVREHGFWGYFLALGLAFVTGLLLSFSPCTYPMVPITVSIFAGRERSVARGFGLSMIYVVSMAVVYGIMGLIVSLVGGVFGAWLASPPVVIAIVVIFVVFALSMFGLYELQVPMALRSKLGKKGGGGVFSVILLGLVAALVVSPCVGPFVAGILIYVAASGSPAIGFLVLFVFAMGLGALYVLIGTFSSAISKLPDSGEWMESVKKFFGFVLLLMALYFLRSLLEPWVTALLAGVLLVAFGVFGGGLDRLTHESTFFPRLKKFLGILALIIGVYLLVGVLFSQGMILPVAAQWLPSMGGPSAQEQHSIDWETDLEQGLARARREGKPVVIDTWATWCVNCRVLEKKTFGNPAVAALVAERFVPIKVQLESADTEITKGFMARFGMSHYSLPTTLLLNAEGNVQRVLRGVVEPDDMMVEMGRVG